MLKGFVSGEEKDIVRIPMKGKNLLDFNVLFGDNPDRTSTYFTYYKIVLEPNTQYTMITNVPNYMNDQCPYMFGTQNIMSAANDGVYSNEPKTITSNPDGSVFIACRIIPNANPERYITKQDFDNGTYYIMLNLGSTALPYEPYGYQEGWEVRDNEDRILWGREDELQTATGTLPFKGYGLPLKVKSLLGNAVQNGTPAPDNIIMPEMCGVRTENLFDGTKYVNTSTNSTERWEYSTSLTGSVYRIPCKPNTTYTLYLTENIDITIWRICDVSTNAVPNAQSTSVPITRSHANSVPASKSATFTTSSNAKYILFQTNESAYASVLRVIMLVEGTTKIPYEPYGWKVHFENHGENLWNEDYTGISGDLKYVPVFVGDGMFTLSTDTPSYSGNAPLFLLSGNVTSGASTPTNGVYNGVSRTTNSSNGYITIAFRRQSESTSPITHKTMLSLGSTPKPYSPYLNETLPVYLGEVPTVRRIKKLVLTSTTAEWTYDSTYNRYVFRIADSLVVGVRLTPVVCSHFVPISDGRSIGDVPNNAIYSNSQQTTNNWFIKTTDYTTASSFKQFLDDELAAGHPVTVWYVLANEQTTISNEPLCKISTYADELTTIQVHGLSAPLYGIGDYKDTLNLSTGVVTRKVKRLVLTGTEYWLLWGGNYFSDAIDSTANVGSPLFCTHFINSNSAGMNIGAGSSRLKIASAAVPFVTSVGDLKAWLAAQYAAGTPVCLWHVLATSTTETVTVPTGMTGEIEGYLTQVSTPTPTNRSVPKWNGVEETGGTYAVTVYTPPEIPTTTGQNTLTVETNLAPSKLEVSIHAKKIHYGFKIDKSNDNSEDAVIYTHDAVTMTPAHMDFTNDRFDYGSWGNAFFVRDCYPVALNLDGTIAYRLDPDDYTKKTDGTASDIFYELLTAAPSDWSTQWKQYYTKSGDEYVLNDQSSAPTFATDTYYKLTYNSSFTGNFMMAFPKVWFYRHEDSQYNYIEISNYKLSDDWKCYAHINASGQEVDFIYLPLFKGVIVNSKLRSLPGQIPQGNTTATDEVNAATALGSRWQIWDHSSAELINDLLTLMSKSIDSQGRFGKGRESGYNSADTVTYGKLQTGTLIKSGKFHGFSSSYKEVKVFGIESFWANRWDRLQGMLLVNNVWKIKMIPPYNFTGTDFVTLSNAEVPSGDGYLSKVQTFEYGSIPASIANGSSTKYFKDYFYKTATDTRVALRGGGCNAGGYAGFRSVSVYGAASFSAGHIGASPVYK